MQVLLLFVVIFCDLLVPGLRMPVGLPTLHIGDFIAFACVTTLLFSGRASLKETLFAPGLRWLTIPYIAMATHILLVTLAMALFSAVEVPLLMAGIFHCFSMYRPLLVLMMILGFRPSARAVRALGTFIILLLLAELALAYAQNQNWANVNGWLTIRYYSEDLTSEKRGMVMRSLRATGTFANPNVLGTALSFMGTMALSRLIFGPGSLIRLVAGAASALALVVTVWLTSSRQGTVCVIAGGFTVLALAMFSRKHRMWAIVVAILVFFGLSTALAMMRSSSALADRFEMFTYGTSVYEDRNFVARFGMWAEHVVGLGPYLITGKGATWLITSGEADSGFVTALVLGGVIALTLFVLTILGPSVAAWRYLRACGFAHPDTWLHATACAVFVPLLLANIPNNTVGAGRQMTLLMMMYGLSFAAVRARSREAEQESASYEPLGSVAYPYPALAPHNW